MTHGTLAATHGHGAPDDLGDLLTRCAQGDVAAFSSLYDAAASRVYGLSMRVLGDHFHAEDATNESFIELWRCAARFDPSKGTAQAWIFTIAHHKAVSRVRSATAVPKREAKYHSLDGRAVEHDPTGDLAIRHAEGDRVHAAVNRLTPLQRQAVELAYFDGLTYPEVAADLQIPLSTAKTRIRDGLVRLRAELAGLGQGARAG